MSPSNNKDILSIFLREQVGLRFGNVAGLLRDLAKDEVPRHVTEGLLAVADYLQRTSEAARDLASDAPDASGGIRSVLLDAHSQQVRTITKAPR